MTHNKIGYSVKEAAQQIGVSESFVRLEVRRGNLKAKRTGANVSIPIKSLEDYYNQLPEWTPGSAPEAANAARRKAGTK